MTDEHMLVFSIDERIVYFYRASAVIVGFLSGYVAWLTERDHSCNKNTPWIRDVRRWGLFLTASVLVLSAVFFSIEALIGVFYLGTANMAINAIALKQRERPPNDGKSIRLGGVRTIQPFTALNMIWRKSHRSR